MSLSRNLTALGLLCAAHAGNAATIDPGQLLISELMPDPAAVSDSRGEWFELYNAGSDPLSLDGLLIHTGGGSGHTVTAPELTLAAGGFALFARNGDSAENGGLTPDYVYGSGVSLLNGGGTLALSAEGTDMARIDYGGGFASAGHSRELLAPVAFSDGSHYGLTPTTSVYGLGDIGTPGAAGSVELSVNEVPLPSSAVLFGGALALVGAGLRARRAPETPGADSALCPA